MSEEVDQQEEEIDIDRWEVVSAFGQKWLGLVEIVRQDGVDYLQLCPVFDYVTRTPIDPKNLGKLTVQRQTVVVELMRSRPMWLIPIAMAGRNPIKTYDEADKATFVEMIRGAWAVQKDIHPEEPAPRVGLHATVPQHLAGRLPQGGRRR